MWRLHHLKGEAEEGREPGQRPWLLQKEPEVQGQTFCPARAGTGAGILADWLLQSGLLKILEWGSPGTSTTPPRAWLG